MQLTLNCRSSDANTTLCFTISEPVGCVDGSQCEIKLNDAMLAPHIIGIDPMNAVENAFAFIRAYLSSRRDMLVWADGSPYEDLTSGESTDKL
jgi:hypothetical protein